MTIFYSEKPLLFQLLTARISILSLYQSYMILKVSTELFYEFFKNCSKIKTLLSIPQKKSGDSSSLRTGLDLFSCAGMRLFNPEQ